LILDKHTFEGYPLKVNIFNRARYEVYDAICILQQIGIDYMVENGMKDILVQKGMCFDDDGKLPKGQT